MNSDCKNNFYYQIILFHSLLQLRAMFRFKGEVLLKGRRITDTREDYSFDTDSEHDSDIEDEHTIAKDERLVSANNVSIL